MCISNNVHSRAILVVGSCWNQVDSNMNNQWSWATMMALLKFIGFPWRHHNQQGAQVTLMWRVAFVAVWQLMWHLHVAGRNFEKILSTLNKRKNRKISSWWLALCVCKACWSGLDVCEHAGKERAILEDGKGTVESLLFRLVGPAHFYGSGSVCKLPPF